MDDLILPGGRPLKLTTKIDLSQSLLLSVTPQEPVRVVDARQSIELGPGRWRVVAEDVYVQLVGHALQRETAAAEPPKPARRRRKLQP